ncbi:MAG TPA: retroviral-like aspartic protease family protein [Sphingomicrobium sp.]|jgi:predicted aspartyl protease|nr:retroviral-like aspartic protease family protein [Sphingomicrobium sp.]
MRLSLLALLTLSSSAAVADPPVTTKLDAVAGIPGVDRTTRTEDVQFKSGKDERLTVPVRVSGYGPFRFLVDTGSDRTAISRQLAGRLGLPADGNASVHSITGVATVSTADLPSVQLTSKPVKVRGAPLLESTDIGADGIIGVDSLRSQSVLFDFEKQTLSIVPAARAAFRDEPDTIVIEAARRNGRLIMTDAKADGQAVSVVIDTGAELSIGNEALRQQLVNRGLVDPMQKVQMLSVTGALLPGDIMIVRDLDIGGLKLRNLAVVFADAHSFKELKLDREPALLLGMNAIRAFKKVSIDFANRKFRVVLPEESQLDVRLASARLK